MKRKKNRPRKRAADRSMLQIKTTIDFGEAGIPLERLGEITKLLKERHVGLMSKVKSGFVPIPFERYVDLHVQSNSGCRPRPAPHALLVLRARRGRTATTRSTKRWAFRPAEAESTNDTQRAPSRRSRRIADRTDHCGRCSKPEAWSSTS
jgi:hypothetical protein